MVGESLCDICRKLLLSSNNFTSGHLVKIEWLVAGVTPVRSLDRAKCATCFGGDCVAGYVFGQSRSFLWSGSDLCGVRTPS